MTTAGYFEGYLQLSDASGSCVEVFNSCRTLSYIQTTEGRLPIEVNADCESCCCHHVDEGYGAHPGEGPNEAPWYDPNIAASRYFLGLYGDLLVGPATVNGRVRQRLTFTGWLMATCDEGRIYGNQWLQEQIDPRCGGCDGFESTVFSHCGAADLVDLADVAIDNPRPDETIGRDCCDPLDPLRTDPDLLEPPILDESPGAPSLPDDGQRVVMALTYVPDSYAVTDANALPGCLGVAITFSFDIDTTHIFSEAIEICDLGVEDPDGDGVLADTQIFDDCYCMPIALVTDVDEECSRCGFSCACQNLITEPTTENTHPSVLTSVDFGECQYSLPICFVRRTCVTPPLPYNEVVPIISIEAGPTDLALLITMWEAHPGLPDPQTCLGHEIYCGRSPIVEPWQVYVPSGTSMILDGREQTAYHLCDGRQPPGSLVSTGPGTRLEFPSVGCSGRIWIAFDADCYNLPDLGARITVEMAGRYRV